MKIPGGNKDYDIYNSKRTLRHNPLNPSLRKTRKELNLYKKGGGSLTQTLRH